MNAPDAMTVCNGCDAAPADPVSPAGYCAECERDARAQDDEPDDGLILIAGVLYDAETLEEAEIDEPDMECRPGGDERRGPHA